MDPFFTHLSSLGSQVTEAYLSWLWARGDLQPWLVPSQSLGTCRQRTDLITPMPHLLTNCDCAVIVWCFNHCQYILGCHHYSRTTGGWWCHWVCGMLGSQRLPTFDLVFAIFNIIDRVKNIGPKYILCKNDKMMKDDWVADALLQFLILIHKAI